MPTAIAQTTSRAAESPRKAPAYLIEHDAALSGAEREGLTFWLVVADVVANRAWEVELTLDPEVPGDIASVRLCQAAEGDGDFKALPAGARDARLTVWLMTAPLVRRYALAAHEDWAGELEEP